MSGERCRRGTAMAIQDARRKLTYEDYECIPDDGLRHEILDGDHYVSPAPARRHQRAALKLGGRLDTFVEENSLGEVLIAPYDVVLSPHDIAQPDVLFVSKERAGISTEKNLQGAPDLLIEILSDRTRKRDEEIKRDLYERFGVKEYWLVDPVRQTVLVYRREGDRFHRAGRFSAAAGDVLTTPLLLGLEIPLREIFL
jgi:Uma2 family endonuclease